MDTNYINLKRRTNNAKRGIEFRTIINVYKNDWYMWVSGEKYELYLDYSNILILVCVTDMWYIYVDDYMLEHTEIVDDLLLTLGGIMEW